MDNEIKLSLRLNTKPVQLKWEKKLWEFCTVLKPS